jgi:hypothetical protein
LQPPVGQAVLQAFYQKGQQGQAANLHQNLARQSTRIKAALNDNQVSIHWQWHSAQWPQIPPPLWKVFFG